MSDISKLQNAYQNTPPAISGSQGTGTNLIQMGNQGITSSDSGVNYPSNAYTASQLTTPGYSGQPLTPQFRAASQIEIEQTISKAQRAGAVGQPFSIYGVNRNPWTFAVFEDIASESLLSKVSSQSVANATVNSSSPEVSAATSNLLANTFIQATNTQNALIWTANPKSVSWQVNQRGSEIKNKSGTILHVWRDRTRKSDYDDPKLVFQFQTGNIMPNNGASGQSPLQISTGLQNFYQFLGLVDRSKLTKNGKANVVHILYRSNIFPALILTGFFDPQALVQFSDDSQNPFTVMGWQAGFTVYSTIPKINNPALLQAMFQNNGLAAFQTPQTTTNTNNTTTGGSNFNAGTVA